MNIQQITPIIKNNLKSFQQKRNLNNQSVQDTFAKSNISFGKTEILAKRGALYEPNYFTCHIGNYYDNCFKDIKGYSNVYAGNNVNLHSVITGDFEAGNKFMSNLINASNAEIGNDSYVGSLFIKTNLKKLGNSAHMHEIRVDGNATIENELNSSAVNVLGRLELGENASVRNYITARDLVAKDGLDTRTIYSQGDVEIGFAKSSLEKIVFNKNNYLGEAKEVKAIRNLTFSSPKIMASNLMIILLKDIKNLNIKYVDSQILQKISFMVETDKNFFEKSLKTVIKEGLVITTKI